MNLKTVFLQMVYPEGIKCSLCGKELFEETRFSLCPSCLPDLVVKSCLRCGRSMKNDADYCLDCQNYPPAFDRAYAPCVFEGNAVRLIHKLKYGNERYLAKYLARYMYDCLAEKDFLPDAVTFVPMHKRRKRERGYNQAEELAKEVARLIGVENAELILRTKYSANLARMSARERREAVKDTFSAKEGVELKGKSVLLIDDVFTTGATSGACAEILKRQGAIRVEVLTFATSAVKVELY